MFVRGIVDVNGEQLTGERGESGERSKKERRGRVRERKEKR